jgi:hypothetical protein
MLTRTQALANLTANAALTDNFPCLTTEQLEECLDANLRATVWLAGATLVPGQLVLPPVASWNGRQYRCLEGGVIPATTFTWPTLRTAYIRQLVSVDPIVLEDNGPAFSELYDMRGALGDAWLLKCQLAVPEHDYGGGSSASSASQVFEHCCMMAAAYGRSFIQ